MAKPSTEYAQRIAKAVKAAQGRVKLQKAMDGFENALTGAGTSRSKTAAATYVRNDLLQPFDLETLFQDNDLAYTIVTKPVEDALRCGFGIERGEGEDAHEDQEAIQEELKRLGAMDALTDAAAFGRLFGGAGVILGVRGAGALSAELDDELATKVEAIYPFDRQDLAPLTWRTNGSVETYLWTQPVMGAAVAPRVVHASRLILFPGATTTRRVRNNNHGWDLSVLQRVYEVLRSFDGMFSSVDSMFSDASQAVFKLQGLIASLAEADGTGDASIQTRLALMDMTRSTGKAVVLDAGDESGVGGEEFEVIDRSTLGTLAPMLEQYYVRLAAAARMPLTVLLGMSPAGMDATGEGDMILYYNSVDIYRRRVLQPRIERLVRLVARGLKLEEPEELTICWPELARPKPLDVATAEKMAIDSVVALILNQVATPEEVALSLKKIAPGLKLHLDPEPRLAAMTEAMTELAAREMTGAVPEPVEPDNTPPTKASARKTPAKARGKQ
jgi:phage-related protein (TIGR01555 family)